MKKMGYLVLLLASLMMAGGCVKVGQQPATSSSNKTVVTSRQYTTGQLQQRYVKISDAVIKPLNLATYKQPLATIKKTAASSQKTLAAIDLQLADNNSAPALTKALRAYVKAGEQTLTSMTGTNQAAYNSASKAFFTQCQALARQSFGGQLPDSVITLSKRSQAAAKASGSASSSSGSTSSSSPMTSGK